MKTNPWDGLSPIFAGTDNLQDVPPEAADNILIAWPVLIDFINQNDQQPKGKRALDYGCGGGRFASKLHALGYETYGTDTSPAMIKNAQQHYGSYAEFTTGDELVARQHGPYDLITSLMAFEFIPDIEQVLPILLSSLKPGGLFVFATHNPEYVKDCLAAQGSPYTNFDSKQHPSRGTLVFGDTAVPIFLRSAQYYQKLLTQLGLAPLLEAYPPFTEDFLARYPTEDPTLHSEYLILGFRKA